MTPFSNAQFRWLLALYCLVVAASFAIAPITKPLIPQPILDAQEASSTSAIANYSEPQRIALLTLAGGVLLAGGVGLIGMFFLLRSGVYIFAVAVFLRIVLSPLMYSWHVSTGWRAVFDEASTLLEGAIFAAVFFGPAKHLFARNKSNQAMQRTPPRSDV